MDTDTKTAPVDPGEDFTSGFDNYWGVDERVDHMLPDGKQKFVIKVMTEGERARYEKEANSDLTVSRAGDTKIKMEPSKQRHALIKAAVVDWYLIKDGKPELFTEGKLDSWLIHANPKIVDGLESAINKVNPWLNAALTTTEIDKQIDELKELRVEAEKRERGE